MGSASAGSWMGGRALAGSFLLGTCVAISVSCDVRKGALPARVEESDSAGISLTATGSRAQGGAPVHSRGGDPASTVGSRRGPAAGGLASTRPAFVLNRQAVWEFWYAGRGGDLDPEVRAALAALVHRGLYGTERSEVPGLGGGRSGLGVVSRGQIPP